MSDAAKKQNEQGRKGVERKAHTLHFTGAYETRNGQSEHVGRIHFYGKKAGNFHFYLFDILAEAAENYVSHSTTQEVSMKVASIFMLVAVSLMGGGYPQMAEAKGVKRTTSSLPKSTDDNCESKINQSNASEAEGEERLQEKNEALSFCASQYKGERKIDALVKDCRKYVSQSVVSQQAVADCQLAAYSYANAIAALRASSSR